ncbi:MAG: membrane dipeptidase [Bacteroidota bacterium]
MTGIPLESASQYFDDAEKIIPVDYYGEDAYPEYEYMAQQEGVNATWDHEYKIVKNFSGYEAAKNAGKIPLFLSIEGGHALINLTENTMLQLEYDELSQLQIDHLRIHLKKNIERIKGQGDALSYKPEHTPIYLTLSHMYQNFLAGHSRTYTEGGILPDIADLLDQEVGLNAGLTDLGREAIDLLISDQNGSRILIDVKHLSVRGRKDYYQIAKQHNLPIIASHVAMAGVEDFVDNPKDSRKDQKKNYFSRWSINLSDLDARLIHESDGIIGIALHEGRMPGGLAKKRIKKIKKQIKKGHALEELLRFQYLKLTMGNIFQIIVAIGEKDAWTRIMIGSDYDGIMNPFDIYPKTSHFQRFIYDLEKFLEKPKPITIYRGGKEAILSKSEIMDYMYGFTPNQIANMIALENFENFMQRHF